MSLDPAALGRAAELGALPGGVVEAVLFYGSRLHRAGPDRHSALDFVVVVSDYGRFHRSLRTEGLLHRPVWVMDLVAQVLPPNSIAFRPDAGPTAKCLVVSRSHLVTAVGPRRRDHFLLGRLSQAVEVAWARDADAKIRAEATLRQARSRAFEWVAPFLPSPFSAEDLGRRILEVSYATELRPEETDRAVQVFEAQRERFLPALHELLEEGVRAGLVERSGTAYRLSEPVSARVRRRAKRYMRRSRVLSTARWFKHVATFDGWLDYAVRKVERRTGQVVRLGPLERRWPLIFLWPRIVRVFRARRDRESRG